MKNFLKNMLSSNDCVSSKRVAGFLGWISCIGVTIYCTIKTIESPGIAETLFICSTSLLGLETIFNVFKKDKKDGE